MCARDAGARTYTQICTGNAKLVKALKGLLESENAFDKSQKITCEDSTFCLASLVPRSKTAEILSEYSDEISLREKEVGADVSENSLKVLVELYFEQNAIDGQDGLDTATLIKEIPKRWSMYTPMVLFNSGTFDSESWSKAFATCIDRNEFFPLILKAFPANFTHLAINKPIVEKDIKRRPFNLLPLWGNFGPEPTVRLYDSPSSSDMERAFWCSTTQNGIHQFWAPRYTMFSRGNIKEKKRILDTYKNCEGQVALDLYAGIGYFTFSYLACGATVFCWEINPWSVEGLVKGLTTNKIPYKVVDSNSTLSEEELRASVADGVRAFVFHESNERATERLQGWHSLPVAHVNLGLLPTSKQSWPIARSAALGSGCPKVTIHVHENVHKNGFGALQKEVEEYYNGQVVHIAKVKSFAPDVWHVVLDTVIARRVDV